MAYLFTPADPAHFTPEEWATYKATLSDAQVAWLRKKATWEHLSLSAVALHWGTPDPSELPLALPAKPRSRRKH
jgi:hypothetical protein